ncbi:ladderlectin-like [Perca fluviatilis]|uniref:ladderlectin-like n=1 Tax=Perca fluviatilis TaxID=8168 RepID=UPI001963A1E5|nr:ladderlectin-like [Perca fluviatilis]
MKMLTVAALLCAMMALTRASEITVYKSWCFSCSSPPHRNTEADTEKKEDNPAEDHFYHLHHLNHEGAFVSLLCLYCVSLLVCALMALTTAAAVPEAEPGQKIGPLVQEGRSHIVEKSLSCPRGWTRYNGRCFLYVPTRAMTWAKAERDCQSLGGNLESVHNIQEYQEIQKLIATTSHESKETWIGGSNAQEDSIWLWSDGSRFIYVNWCAAEPDNYQGRQHCLQMNYSDGKCCDDVECFALHPFVCSKKIR